MTPSRRARASVSLEIQAHARHMARFSCPCGKCDIAVCKALVQSEFSMFDAARLAGMKPAAFRQKFCGYQKRLRSALGGYTVGSGARPKILSYDADDGELGASAGITS